MSYIVNNFIKIINRRLQIVNNYELCQYILVKTEVLYHFSMKYQGNYLCSLGNSKRIRCRVML